MNPKSRALSGLLFFVASLTFAATPTKKHQRGTGLIPPQPTAQGKLPKTPSQPTASSKLTPSGRSKIPANAAGTMSTSTPDAGAAEAAATSQGTCAKKPPIEDYVRIASAWAPQSADEHGVFFLSDRAEVPQVFHQKNESTEARPLTKFPDGVPYFSLSPDGKKILAATHVGGDEQYRVHFVDTATGQTFGLVEDEGARVESVHWASDSKWFAYTSNKRNKVDFDLYRFDLEGKKSTLLAELEGHNSVTDVSPDGKALLIERFRSISDSDVLIHRNGIVENLTRAFGPAAHGGGRFTSSGSQVVMTTDAPHGISRLVSLSLKASESAKTKGTKDLTNEKWEIESFKLAHDRKTLVYLVNEDGYSRAKVWSLDSEGRLSRPWPLAKQESSVARSVDFSYAKGGGANGLFVADTSSTRPSEVWLERKGTSQQWTRSSPKLAIDPSCFHAERLVHYPTFDGRKIPAFLYEPHGEIGAKGPAPYLVYVHGGPESQFRPTFNRVFQYFLQRGFGIFAPNVRGSTGYGREYADLDNYKKRMDSVQDAVEGARWLLSQRLATQGRLAIYGGSYGGFMVLRAIQVAPELFAAASESVGISDFVTFLENTKPYRRALREVEYGPLADRAFLKSISPMSYLELIKTPLYVFHGANDPRVPASEANQIVDALRKRDVPVELKIFADEGHGNAKLANQLEQARLMAHFFEKQLEKSLSDTQKK